MQSIEKGKQSKTALLTIEIITVCICQKWLITIHPLLFKLLDILFNLHGALEKLQVARWRLFSPQTHALTAREI